jgi:hypothetical protein
MAIMESTDLLMRSTDNKTVKGTVTAFHNYYLRNVEVTVKKTGSKTLTDSLGRFEVMASNGDVLIFAVVLRKTEGKWPQMMIPSV